MGYHDQLLIKHSIAAIRELKKSHSEGPGKVRNAHKASCGKGYYSVDKSDDLARCCPSIGFQLLVDNVAHARNNGRTGPICKSWWLNALAKVISDG